MMVLEPVAKRHEFFVKQVINLPEITKSLAQKKQTHTQATVPAQPVRQVSVLFVCQRAVDIGQILHGAVRSQPKAKTMKSI